MLNERLFLSFRHVMYSLRGGFLVRPLIIALALGCAGALLSALEETVPGLGAWAPKVLFPSHADPQVAQVVLAAIAASMMTVVSIVFAILLMTLTLASMQFSPRIIVSFARDRVTQQTLGIFLGTFSYCVAALPGGALGPAALRARPDRPRRDAARAGLRRVVALLHPPHLAGDQRQSHRGQDRHRDGGDHRRAHAGAPAAQSDAGGRPARAEREREGAVSSDVSGYVRFIDIDRLVFLAKSYGVVVRVVRRVGHFVPAGVPLLMVSKGERLSPDRSAELRGAFDLGPTRTLQQDVEFGILQIVDIALAGDLARRERPQHRHQLRGPAEPHPDPLRLPGRAGVPALRSSGPSPRLHSVARLRPARGRGIRPDPPLLRGRTSRSACECCGPWATSPRRSRTTRFD